MRAREIDYKAAQTLVEKGHFSLSRAAAKKAAYDTAVALHKQRKVELNAPISAPLLMAFLTPNHSKLATLSV